MNTEQEIHTLLTSTFKPTYLLIKNESHQHQRAGDQTHFNITIVSECFVNHNRLKRHQQVNKKLAPLFKKTLHGIQLTLKTPQEWEQCPQQQHSPSCAGKRQ